jgi:hypothetical protein
MLVVVSAAGFVGRWYHDNESSPKREYPTSFNAEENVHLSDITPPPAIPQLPPNGPS